MTVGAQEAAREQGIRLAQRLVATLRDKDLLPQIYPALFQDGIDEGSLHAYMLSALVLVGDRLGFTPVADSPIFDRLDKLLTGEGAKRPDAVWFDRSTQQVQCLVEYERYTARSLAPKARNLLIMGKELHPAPQLAVLDYWTYTSVPSAALQEVRAIFSAGFTHPAGISFPPLACPVLVLETVVAESDGRPWVHTVQPRLFISRGEDKPYIVQELALA